jgi:hypothetical protein
MQILLVLGLVIEETGMYHNNYLNNAVLKL